MTEELIKLLEKLEFENTENNFYKYKSDDIQYNLLYIPIFQAYTLEHIKTHIDTDVHRNFICSTQGAEEMIEFLKNEFKYKLRTDKINKIILG